NIGKKGANETVAMLPGEMVSIDKNSSGYSKTKVNPEVYSSWKVGKLTLDRTSLQELLTMIEDTYGVRIHVVEKDLLDKRISGRIPADNIDTLIQDIAAIYKVELKNYAVPYKKITNNHQIPINKKTKNYDQKSSLPAGIADYGDAIVCHNGKGTIAGGIHVRQESSESR